MKSEINHKRQSSITVGKDLRRLITSREGIIIFGVSVVIGLLLPSDILTRIPLLASFVKKVGQFFPPVDAYQRSSKFPEISGLYFSVMYFVTPLFLVFAVRKRATYLPGLRVSYLTRRIRYLASVLFTTGIGIVLFYLLYFKNDGFSYESIPMNSSRLALALIGCFFAGGSAWSFAGVSFLALWAIFKRN